MWAISPYRQQLICTLKEHKAPVSAVDINKAGTEAVSASTDGTCIIWDLVRQCRRHIMFGTTLFMCARYFPTDVQILTGGSDRKLSYWEVLDGTLVREVEGSSSGAINALDISEDGKVFVTVGNDQIVKLWDYQLGNYQSRSCIVKVLVTGVTTHIGEGHSAVITAARFSPDQKNIVTTSGSGSIFIWKCPEDMVKETKDEEPPAETPEKGESKEETIQDLPTERSEKSVNKQKGVCTCPCTKRVARVCGNVVEKPEVPVGGVGDGDNVKSPEVKASPKSDTHDAAKCASNGTPKGTNNNSPKGVNNGTPKSTSGNGNKTPSVKGSGKKT